MKNECWINSIYDCYHDTLLRTDKKRNMITRATILEVLGRTEDNIKQGLTVDDVLPFFVKDKLMLRVFDVFYKLIFKYDPPVENNNNKPMYVLADGDHVYTLNHDLKRLEQKQEEEGESDYVVSASTDYNIREDRDVVSHKMISHIDDILKILRETKPPEAEDKQQQVTYLVQRENNMESILWTDKLPSREQSLDVYRG